MNFSFPESDELNDLITAPVDTTKQAQVARAEQQIGFTETCTKCRGRGKFVGRNGRIFGDCFACKGAGSKTFKASAAKRAQTRATAGARKQRNLAEGIEAFKAAHPAIWAWLEGNEWGPAQEFRAKLFKYGSVFDSSIEWAYRCIAKRDAVMAERKAADAARVEQAPSVDLTKIEAAFAKASSALRAPRLRLAGLVISPATASGKNAGALYVKADGNYIGKIAGGKFLCTRECDEPTKARVLDACNDPTGAAIAYGRMTGNCACCGRTLTNGESIERGIGPICADVWGL